MGVGRAGLPSSAGLDEPGAHSAHAALAAKPAGWLTCRLACAPQVTARLWVRNGEALHRLASVYASGYWRGWLRGQLRKRAAGVVWEAAHLQRPPHPRPAGPSTARTLTCCASRPGLPAPLRLTGARRLGHGCLPSGRGVRRLTTRSPLLLCHPGRRFLLEVLRAFGGGPVLQAARAAWLEAQHAEGAGAAAAAPAAEGPWPWLAEETTLPAGEAEAGLTQALPEARLRCLAEGLRVLVGARAGWGGGGGRGSIRAPAAPACCLPRGRLCRPQQPRPLAFPLRLAV